ncbi:RDS/peripherin-like protein xRDS35 isoform X1 [Pieris rapae]|uniref:RDS/peripherin-like protein xRDS35 isoform X1 n=2 Tax=Pieris rapae TaxID=64459 RepID=UPI001E27CF21|nr:RDS/peripherin-like protein xRDS35 isoform X1 [Pieris rapae]
MAWRGLTFSREGRERLANVLRALLITQVIISLVMAIFCYNVSFRVMSLLKNIHKLTVYLLYGLILLQAYCMKLHYTSGLRLLTWAVQYPHWKRTACVTRIWMISGSLVAVNGMLVYAACRSTLKGLLKELSSSLRLGISQYLTEPSWKTLLDTMQVELNCCGADQPSDWYEIPWINIDYLNESSDLAMKLAGSDGRVSPPVTPYSCCTPRVLAACYHDPLQQWEWREAWSSSHPLVGASLHARGCVDAVRAPLTRATLALQLCNLLSLIVQVVIVCLSQVMVGSARDAVVRGDAAGVGRAALFTPPVNEDAVIDSEVCVARTSVPRRRRVRRLRTRLSYPYLS